MLARSSAALCFLLLLLHPGVKAYSQATRKGPVGKTLHVTDAGAWRIAGRGLETRTVMLERLDPSYTLELKLLRIDRRFVTPRVLHASQLQLKAATVKTFAEMTGAIAAVNANYFDEKGRALAYLKTADKEINRNISKHALYTGIFGVNESGPFVTHRDEFQPDHAGEALQSGPLLLHRAVPVEIMPGLGRYARRSVIGLDRDGKMVAGVTDAVIGGLSFSEMQELFSRPQWQLNAVELLNLDGGGSAQLYLRAGKVEEWLPGTSEIPAAIGFFAKAG